MCFSLSVPLHQVVICRAERTLFSCCLCWCRTAHSRPSQLHHRDDFCVKWLVDNDPKPKAAVQNMLLWQTLTVCSTHRYTQSCVHTHTHTSCLPPDVRLYVTENCLPAWAEVNQWANTICDMLSCPCVALKGFVGLGSKLSKTTKWVARCREELLRFTRQDSLHAFYFFTLCHAPGKPWANPERRQLTHQAHYS